MAELLSQEEMDALLDGGWERPTGFQPTERYGPARIAPAHEAAVAVFRSLFHRELAPTLGAEGTLRPQSVLRTSVRDVIRANPRPLVTILLRVRSAGRLVVLLPTPTLRLILSRAYGVRDAVDPEAQPSDLETHAGRWVADWAAAASAGVLGLPRESVAIVYLTDDPTTLPLSGDQVFVHASSGLVLDEAWYSWDVALDEALLRSLVRRFEGDRVPATGSPEGDTEKLRRYSLGLFTVNEMTSWSADDELTVQDSGRTVYRVGG